MITEQDLQEAIAECEGQRNPNANTCIKLAAFYTIKQHMFGGQEPSYSYAVAPAAGPTYTSETEFGKIAEVIDSHALMPVIDDLISTLSVINPPLYSSFMRKLREL